MNEQWHIHPSQQLKCCSHSLSTRSPASSLDTLHKNGIRPRAFLRQTGLHVAFLVFEVPYRLTGQTGSIALALTSSLYSPSLSLIFSVSL